MWFEVQPVTQQFVFVALPKPEKALLLGQCVVQPWPLARGGQLPRQFVQLPDSPLGLPGEVIRQLMVRVAVRIHVGQVFLLDGLPQVVVGKRKQAGANGQAGFRS